MSLPQSLIERLNELIPARQRSTFIAQAVDDRLAALEMQQALTESFGAWKDEDYPHLRTNEDIDAFLREIRQTYARPEWNLPEEV